MYVLKTIAAIMLALCEKQRGGLTAESLAIHHIRPKEKKNHMISSRFAKKHLMKFNTHLEQ